MKRFSILGVLLIMLSLIACGGNSPEKQQTAVPNEFRAQFSDALNSYFALKDALVASDAAAAVEKAKVLKTTLENIPASSLSDPSRAAWDTSAASILKAMDQLTGTSDLNEQRSAFLNVSEGMISVVKELNAAPKTIYVQNCPMAFNRKGGDWLSDKKEIFNPYFGEGEMFHCGTIKETLAVK